MAHVINASEFESKVMQAQGPVMVDFFATWCGPCKMLAPVLDEVAAEVEDKAAVYKVDIDRSPELAQRFGIMSVPTILVFVNGEVKRSTMGAQPKQKLLALLGLALYITCEARLIESGFFHRAEESFANAQVRNLSQAVRRIRPLALPGRLPWRRILISTSPS